MGRQHRPSVEHADGNALAVWSKPLAFAQLEDIVRDRGFATDFNLGAIVWDALGTDRGAWGARRGRSGLGRHAQDRVLRQSDTQPKKEQRANKRFRRK